MDSSFLHIAYNPIYAHPLPVGHRFPMLKYELIPEQLMYEGTITSTNLISPEACSLAILLTTHTQEYISKLTGQLLNEREQRIIGFPQSPLLTSREFIIAQGTIDCSIAALTAGVALNVAGGTHHAFADHGEGFCMINDIAVAANYLLLKQRVKKVLIIDLDVHQGNGTAKIFEENNNVFTFSMHGQHNYPFRKEKSNLDVGLADGTNDDTYLGILTENLNMLLETVKPDFAFYLSGVDILETDKFGKLNVTLKGCKKRDEIVFTKLKELKIPCAVSLGGGYSADVKIITEAHCNTFRLAKEIFDLN